MTRVLFLNSNSPLPLTFHMMHLLRRVDGYAVHLLYYQRQDHPDTWPLPVSIDEEQCSSVAWPVGTRFLGKAINRVTVIGLLAKKAREFSPDVIHAWSYDMLLAARIAAVGLPRARIAFTLQDTTEWMLSPFLRAMQRRAYRWADIIFVTSEGFESRLLRKLQLIDDDKEVVYVPNVPPADQFAHFRPRRPGSTLTVGHIGTLRGVLGITTLVKAAGMARDMGSDVRVLFAGAGLERDLVEGLAERNAFVDYLGPYRYDEQIAEIYGQVDVLYAVYDQTYDKKIHLAYRLCEAINCRLPIIVAQGTYMCELVESLGVGVSVEPGDAEGLASALATLCQSEAQRRLYARSCARARRQFVFEFYQDRILEAYDQLCSGGGAERQPWSVSKAPVPQSSSLPTE